MIVFAFLYFSSYICRKMLIDSLTICFFLTILYKEIYHFVWKKYFKDVGDMPGIIHREMRAFNYSSTKLVCKKTRHFKIQSFLFVDIRNANSVSYHWFYTSFAVKSLSISILINSTRWFLILLGHGTERCLYNIGK